MTDITLRDDLVQRLQEIARQEKRQPDEVLEILLNQYNPSTPTDRALDDELWKDTLRIYDRARRYWQAQNDPRWQMTNDELDQQFWLINSSGIQHLKDEQSTLTLPPDPLEQMLNIAEADTTILWKSPARLHNFPPNQS